MISRDYFAIARRLGFPKRDMVVVVGLAVAQSLFEAGAILLLLPVLQFIQANGDLALLQARHAHWPLIVGMHSALDLEVTLAGLLAAAFASILGRQALQYLQRMATARLKTAQLIRMRVALFDAVARAELGQLDGDRTGRLVTEFTSEVETALAALFFSLQTAVLACLGLVYGVALLALSWQMTAAALVMLGVALFAVRRFLAVSSSIGGRVSTTNQDVGAFLVERLRSIRFIRLSHAETSERDLAVRLMMAQGTARIDAERVNARLSASIEPLFVGLAFACLWLGASRLGLGLETLGVFMVIVLRLVPIGKDLLSARQVVLQSQPGLELIDGTLVRLHAAAEINQGDRVLAPPGDGIRFESVGFAYPDGRTALRDVDLEVAAGRMTAIVGPSGAGKSTLVDLLPRLRVPTKGAITIDQCPIDRFTLSSLRSAIAYVPQTPVLFDGTIADHVRYSSPRASEADLYRALELALAADFVAALPKGIDTRIGEAGALLSGGQRQRLDLARALAQNASIMILDEPTSALDAASEALFWQALDRVRAELAPTILVIAHRLSTIASADHIAVLDDGRVVEEGTHAELLAQKGWYSRAWVLQSFESAASA